MIKLTEKGLNSAFNEACEALGSNHICIFERGIVCVIPTKEKCTQCWKDYLTKEHANE